ncbi:hypothetical protein K7W03_01340 [Sphingobium sp. PNB]|uniref:hypothetical protein n=1 Tax=Sphingobium sp. PNB TaxID=863934 RepID=UPI001CA43E5B|nr:hypothetical protein [Sphingobium sp. PNB]MCB4858230.1 hypothetical protein [Sphingobium sp. PNB]
MRGDGIALGRRTTGPEREAEDHLAGGRLCPQRRRKTEDQPQTHMLANLRNDMLREIGEVRFDIREAVIAQEGIAQETGDERIDQRVALLRRHEVLHRKHTMLAIDDRFIEQAIEIGGNEKRVVDDIEDMTAAWRDVRRDREAADCIPELRWAATCFVKMID